ncbi:MAG TPA: DMT family transporter [Gammaproteobacteria bacterium]|nr:DMT family transporter [Gammaproteobacteria bacterium]
MTGITHSATTSQNNLLPTTLVLLACFCFGTIPCFARSLTDAGMASHAVAFYRYGISALVLFPLLLRLPRSKWKTILWGLASAALVGLGWVGYVSGLKTVPVSTIGVLYMTYPLFTILIGWAWFRDKPSFKALCGASIVILAALLASSPAAVEPRHLPAMLISLSAPISFGIGINILVHKLMPISPIDRVASFSLGAALSLMPLLIDTDPRAALPQTPAEWQLIAGLALATALIPQLIYTTFAHKIGAARSAVAGSIELPTMFLIGWFALGESIGPLQWLACLLITLAILLTPARATRSLTTQLVMPRKPQ